MIGWGPGQKALVHDHPVGGCLGKFVKGPGITETNYWKRNLSRFGGDGALHDKIGIRNNTRLYKCLLQSPSGQHKFYGCGVKGQKFAWISERDEHDVGNKNLQISKLAGFDRMHSCKNPHKKTTLTLHHYYGDYLISFWEEVEHDLFRSGKAHDQNFDLKFNV